MNLGKIQLQFTAIYFASIFAGVTFTDLEVLCQIMTGSVDDKKGIK